MVQKLHLLRRRFHALAVHDQLKGIQIDDELVEHQTALFLLAALALRRAAQDGFDAGKDLLHFKGLRDVVVGTLLEAGDLIGRLALRREHDDRCLGVLPDGAQNAPAVHHRQHDIEQHQVRLELPELVDALAAVVGDHGLIALVVEIELQKLGNIVVILDDQDLFCHRTFSFSSIVSARSRRSFSPSGAAPAVGEYAVPAKHSARKSICIPVNCRYYNPSSGRCVNIL